MVAKDLLQLGCRAIHVNGGEPLLYPPWHKLCYDFSSLGLCTSLITNGTLLDQNNLDQALDVGIRAIGISVDGLQATHDSIRLRPGGGPSAWRETIAAIERALPRIETTIITVVNRRNLAELPALRDFLAGLGVRRWQIQLAIPVGRVHELAEPSIIAPSDLEILTAFLVEARASGTPPCIDTSDNIGYFTERELGLRGSPDAPALWTGCQAGLSVAAITYNGRVRGCSILPPEFDAGDLHDESIITIWNDVERFAYSTRFDAGKLTSHCGHCRVGPLCRAGCTSMAYWTTGSIYSNPFCLHRVRGGCA